MSFQVKRNGQGLFSEHAEVMLVHGSGEAPSAIKTAGGWVIEARGVFAIDLDADASSLNQQTPEDQNQTYEQASQDENTTVHVPTDEDADNVQTDPTER